MVLPPPAADASPRPDWLARLVLALQLAQGALLTRIENADNARIGELVRALLPIHPELELELNADAALRLPLGATYIYVPSLRDAEWLNVNRPVFKRRDLRVVLWCDSETTRLLPTMAPDFCDWISHSIPCPPGEKSGEQVGELSLVEATHKLKQAGAKRPGILAARLNLDRSAIGQAAGLLRQAMSEEDVVRQLQRGGVPSNSVQQGASGGLSAGAPFAIGSAHAEGVSPFVIGAPLERGAQCFVGRVDAIRQLQDCLKLVQPVQLLGEPRMGKTSLLNQVPEWLPKGMPIAALSAQGHCGSSERELVACIAEKLAKPEIARRLVSGEIESAAAALEQLTPCAVLLDEADALTKPEHRFSSAFFDQCRALGQSRRLFWVCAARSDIEVRFQSQGLTSLFLNDCRRIWIGQLEPAARERLLALLPSLTDAQRAHALECAGGFALALQWMADAIWRDSAGKPKAERADNSAKAELLADQLRLEMERHFTRWWQGCSTAERRLLRGAVHGVDRRKITDGERRNLRALVARGLADEGESMFTLPGRIWREFVGEQ